MFFALRYPAPVSASCDDDMTASIILLSTLIGAFNWGGGSSALIGKFRLSLRKMKPPAFEWLFDSLKYDVLECVHKCILEAWKINFGFG